ncbi:MAG TPA: maleylpyruvate isomerase family mycothiol-dependent enzyme [Nocardioidaceae bacterium]|nr:maleylpyruvate isomerase family mycothiol-dependent enzyme [Nocardioidaceae bacterium]
MSLTTHECIKAIAKHSAGFAEAASGNLGARVEHCPDWDVAALVRHLSEVHWFWATIVDGLLPEPPDESSRPAPAPDGHLIDSFAEGANHLCKVLGDADQSAHCWTWAGWKQDVDFVARHQVQEAAVHHWDAAHAAGTDITIAPDVAADSIDEFLHFSVASDDDPDEPVKPPLKGTLAFRATDTGDGWTLTDGTRPGTARVTTAVEDGVPVLEATAADLLLWLYGRVELDTSAVGADLLARFRDMCFTD